MIDTFGGKDGEEQNALMQSLMDCAKDEDSNVYYFLENESKTCLIVLLVDKLHELGYKIVKK